MSEQKDANEAADGQSSLTAVLGVRHGWRLTRACAVMWFIAAALNAVLGEWNAVVMFFFGGAGWAGWAYEERQNNP